MPANPTPEELAAWRVLCEKATPGPWIPGGSGNARLYGPDNTDSAGMLLHRAEDRAFCVAARSALPRLIDALEAAEAKVTTLRDGLDRIRSVATDVWAQDFARQLYEETE